MTKTWKLKYKISDWNQFYHHASLITVVLRRKNKLLTSPQFGWKVLIVASTGLQVQVTLPIKKIKINYHIQLLPLCKTRIDGQKLWNSVLSKVQLLPFAERGHSNGEHPHKRTSMKERVVYQWPLQLNHHTRRKGQWFQKPNSRRY